jgi:catechol 2,3-dioxygenase-like lactoylglutathione lyase family enzyme
MSIQRLDHFNLWVPPALAQATRDFYVNVLGLEDGPRPGLSSQGHWLYAGKQPLVHLSLRGEGEPRNTGLLNHIAFQTDDAATFTARLDAAHVPYRINQAASGLTQLFFHDPCGLMLEVNCPAPADALSTSGDTP